MNTISSPFRSSLLQHPSKMRTGRHLGNALCSLHVLTCFRSHTEKQHLVKIDDNESLSCFSLIFVYRAANESLSEQATEIVDCVVVDLPVLDCVVDSHDVYEICNDPDFRLDDDVDVGQVTEKI
jgi:hypothetical protein